MKHLMQYINDNNIGTITKLSELLKTDFSIKCREDLDANGNPLYTFKYDQINSPKTNPIVRECRGTILDKHLNVVFKGFDRFFNLGEAMDIPEQFDWDNPVEAFEKADGSLVKLYHHHNLWQVGTSSTATAEVPFNVVDSWDNEKTTTFREKIINAFGYASEADFQEDAGLAFFNDLNYVFEFISPENRIVTPYDEPQMVLLAVFHKDGTELSNQDVRYEYEDMVYDVLNVRLPDKHIVNSHKELLALVDSLEGLKEGFVIRDGKGMRLKVKSDLYVAAHRMRGENGLTLRNACKLVLANEHEEYLTYFPDDKDKIGKVVQNFEIFLANVEHTYHLIKNTINQKDFAQKAKLFNYNGLLFTMRRGLSAKEAYYNMVTSRQLSTLEKLVKKDND